LQTLKKYPCSVDAKNAGNDFNFKWRLGLPVNDAFTERVAALKCWRENHFYQSKGQLVHQTYRIAQSNNSPVT